MTILIGPLISNKVVASHVVATEGQAPNIYMYFGKDKKQLHDLYIFLPRPAQASSIYI